MFKFFGIHSQSDKEYDFEKLRKSLLVLFEKVAAENVGPIYYDGGKVGKDEKMERLLTMYGIYKDVSERVHSIPCSEDGRNVYMEVQEWAGDEIRSILKDIRK